MIFLKSLYSTIFSFNKAVSAKNNTCSTAREYCQTLLFFPIWMFMTIILINMWQFVVLEWSADVDLRRLSGRWQSLSLAPWSSHVVVLTLRCTYILLLLRGSVKVIISWFDDRRCVYSSAKDCCFASNAFMNHLILFHAEYFTITISYGNIKRSK